MAAPVTALVCPYCGAPVPPSLADEAKCRYCACSLTGVADVSWDTLLARTADFAADDADGRLACRVAGTAYRIRGRLAKSDRADVFLAETRRRPTELVVLKVGRRPSDDGARLAEWNVLSRLAVREGEGAALFTTLVPQLVCHGPLKTQDMAERPTVVYRWRGGFVHTLRDVARAYPDGIDPRTAVWIWRRILDVLGWVHAAGLAHGAVRPDHVLIHPRDHRVLLVGWSSGTTETAAASADLVASSHCVQGLVAGSSGRGLDGAPYNLRRLLARSSKDVAMDARGLCHAVSLAAREAFGPPRFHPFTMPS